MGTHGPLPTITSAFKGYFERWHLVLPDEDVAARRRGKICEAGWAIWYLFGADEKGEYLDFYASHRMTNDRHLRIYADGKREGLESIREFCLCSQNPVEDARLQAEFYADNQRISKMLEDKGFGMDGDEPGGVQINRYLHLKEPEG